MVKIAVCLFVFCAGLSFRGRAQAVDAPAWFQKAEAALEQRQYRTALAHLNECLRVDPYYFEAYRWRGLARSRLGDASGAITDLSVYLEHHPDAGEVVFARAQLRYEWGQYAAARADFQRLLRLPTQDTHTVFFQLLPEGTTRQIVTTQGNLRASLYGTLGLIEIHLKNYIRAIAYLDSALQMDPQADHWLNKGLAHQYSGQTQEAKGCYERVLALDPQHPYARHNLAQLAQQQGDWREAEALLTAALADHPRLPYAYAERGYYRMNRQAWTEALADFTQAIALDPHEPDYFVNRGIVYEHMKRMEEAILDYNQAIKIRPSYARAWLNRGNAQEKMGRWQQAVDDYTVAIAYAPDYGLAFRNRAVAWHKLKRLKEACQDLVAAEKRGVEVEASLKSRVCQKPAP